MRFGCMGLAAGLGRGACCFLLAGWPAVSGAPKQTSSSASKLVVGLTYEQHIRPILKANCFDCHGEGEKLKGGLDLRLRRLLVEGGESGPGIVPGDPSRSLLFELVARGEMPKRERKLTPAEIQALRDWIVAGAPTARDEPLEIPGGMTITEEERRHWSFQPIRNSPVPSFKRSDRVRSVVDAFLVDSLRREGLGFSPDADRVTLIRRATLELLGLPPTPEEVEHFVNDRAPDAYERLLDRLLESPRYGERWARHWLDAAGYADSEGYTDSDTPRGYAYKYRDYVIRALNSDLPFDRFLTEQLAGDELVPHPHQDLTEDQQDKLIATGYLRMAADGTGGGGVDQDVARNQVMADTLKIVSTSLLGLSVGCAQCHDHRYDPIPQSDYYRLRAVFEPALNWKDWRTPEQRLVSLYTDEERGRAAAVEAEARKLLEEREAKQKQFLAEALDKHLAEKIKEPLREPLRAAANTPADQRTPEQKQLLEDHPSANIHPGVLYQYLPKAADELKAMDAKIAEARAGKPVEDFIHALTERPGEFPVTRLFRRGDPTQPAEVVGPGVLTVLGVNGERMDLPDRDAALASSGRRLAFSRWLTGTNNPLTARVIVNRVWMHHFGRGLVGTPADFGLTGEGPTHPELLDWLAFAFRAPACDDPGNLGLGWSLKRLHRLIMCSTAYRQTSLRRPAGERVDPDNRFYWRKPVVRLEAEAIRDSVLAVSGALNAKMFGPPVPVREDAFGQIVVGIDKKEGDNKVPVEVPMGGEEFRRSIYVQVRRSQPLAFLNVFDAPVMEVNCERRQASTVAPQALMLMNSEFALKQAVAFASRLRDETPTEREQIQRAWRLAFSRDPTASEHRWAADFLAGQRRIVELVGSVRPPTLSTPAAEGEGEKKEKPPSPPEPEPAVQALTDLCQVLLSANEFIYID